MVSGAVFSDEDMSDDNSEKPAEDTDNTTGEEPEEVCQCPISGFPHFY